MRGHELEPRTDDYSSAQPVLYGPPGYTSPGSAYDRPLWLEVGTPKTPGDNLFARLDRGWYFLVYPVRALCVFALMVTYRWYYLAGVVLTVGFLLYLITSTP